MAYKELNPIDHSQIEFKSLGWGVDCTKPEEEWLRSLDHYAGPQIRDLKFDKDHGNVNTIPLMETITSGKVIVDTTSGGVDSKIGVPVAYTGLNVEFTIGYDKTCSFEGKSNTVFETSKTATLRDDISRDPGAIQVSSADGNVTYYTKFEETLSRGILEYIDSKQKKLPSAKLGISVKDLQGETAIAKLQHFTNGIKPHLWQLVADACTFFVQKFQYTHYVYSVTLGKKFTQSQTKKLDEQGLKGGVGVNAPIKCAEVKIDANIKEMIYEGMKYIYVRGDDNNPDVIEVYIKPLSSLISEKSYRLKTIIERLLQVYTTEMNGMLIGPFTVSFYDTKTRELLYWKVSQSQISSIDDRYRASEFYFTCDEEESQTFALIYEDTQPEKNQFYVSYENSPKLQLQRSANIRDILFTLESRDGKKVGLPVTKPGMYRDAYFIKTCGGMLFPRLFKKIGIFQESFIAMKWKKPCGYEAVIQSGTKTDKDLMLFTMKTCLLRKSMKAESASLSATSTLDTSGQDSNGRASSHNFVKKRVDTYRRFPSQQSLVFNDLMGDSDYIFPLRVSLDCPSKGL